ncbi:hypothetical protein D3C78_1631650 [compost metagenome]
MPNLVFILIILIGLLNIFFPSFAWFLKHGWAVDGESEPSEAFLILTRIGGIIAIVIGVVLLTTSLFAG